MSNNIEGRHLVFNFDKKVLSPILEAKILANSSDLKNTVKYTFIQGTISTTLRKCVLNIFKLQDFLSEKSSKLESTTDQAEKTEIINDLNQITSTSMDTLTSAKNLILALSDRYSHLKSDTQYLQSIINHIYESYDGLKQLSIELNSFRGRTQNDDHVTTGKAFPTN